MWSKSLTNHRIAFPKHTKRGWSHCSVKHSPNCEIRATGSANTARARHYCELHKLLNIADTSCRGPTRSKGIEQVNKDILGYVTE